MMADGNFYFVRDERLALNVARVQFLDTASSWLKHKGNDFPSHPSEARLQHARNHGEQ
jgi:hypothetical protein